MEITVNSKEERRNTVAFKVVGVDLQALALRANKHVSERAIKAVQELREQEQEAQRLESLRHKRIEPHLRSEKV